jgi:salicylate hydroxylase
MRERVPQSILSTGKRLSAIEWTGEEYALSFLDGTNTTADIIIGCDGIKSQVRAHLGFADHPNYSGQMVYRGYVAYSDLSPAAALELRKTVIYRGKQRHILTLPIGNDESNTARVGIIGFMTEPLESWVSESWMAKAPVDKLAEQVEGWCPTVQEIIAGLRKSAERGGDGDLILKQALYVRDPIPKWYEVETEHPARESYSWVTPHIPLFLIKVSSLVHFPSKLVLTDSRSRNMHGDRVWGCTCHHPEKLEVKRP